MLDIPQYSIQARNPKHQVVVGWDAPCASFYFQLRHADTTTDQPIKWVGGSEHGALTLDRCLALVAEHADVPTDLKSNLLRDEAQNPPGEDQTAQILMFPKGDRKPR